MPVSIGEIHSEVTSSGGQPPQGQPVPVAEYERADQLQEARRRAEWLRSRVSAEGFED